MASTRKLILFRMEEHRTTVANQMTPTIMLEAGILWYTAQVAQALSVQAFCVHLATGTGSYTVQNMPGSGNRSVVGNLCRQKPFLRAKRFGFCFINIYLSLAILFSDELIKMSGLHLHYKSPSVHFLVSMQSRWPYLFVRPLVIWVDAIWKSSKRKCRMSF